MFTTMTDEKRRIPRLSLEEPVGATVAERAAALLDLSNGGALVEHEFPLKAGLTAVLEFPWEAEKVRLTCVIVRTRLGRSVTKPGSFAYSSGLRFTDPSEPARQLVRQIVAQMSRRH